jgi:dTDP-4-dehydrorhamnose reductase
MTGRPRLLVIGARGFLGGHLMASHDPRFDFTGAGRTGCEIPLDITDQPCVERVFEIVRPDIVALVAAMADIDACERDSAAAFRTNVTGAQRVAAACARRGARLLFASSGAVFDGTSAAYREHSAPNPLSVYGSTKAEAEKTVAALVPDAIVVRLSLLLGLPVHPGTNSLTERLRDALQVAEPVRAPAHEYRNAVDAATAARWMLDLAAAPNARGVFHLGASDALSRYEIAVALAQALGYPADLVTPDDGPPRPGRAPRGRHHLLIPERITQFSSVPVPACREAIERCVHAVA